MGARLLPPPPTPNVMVTAVAVAEVAKRNHLSYVVVAVGAGVPHAPAAPSLTALFILYVMGVQLEEGVMVVATVAQVSAPGVCANIIIGIPTKKKAKKRIRIGDRNLIRLDLVCSRTGLFTFGQYITGISKWRS